MSVETHEFRAYDPGVDEFTSDGYPLAWRYLKHIVRENGEHRCARCKHPYRTGEQGNGEWSTCDRFCTHRNLFTVDDVEATARKRGNVVDARWRILTVHHLDGDKGNLRWWNLAPLDQRCHLTIQGKVYMDRPYDKPHSEWFRPYAAGFYAFKYLGEDLAVPEVFARMDELLALELRQERLFSF